MAISKLIGKGEYVLEWPGEQPQEYFDIAMRNYAHITAPNRRYPDLIMQRLLKNYFFSFPSIYNKEDLEFLSNYCTQKEDDAIKVERLVRKSAVAIILSNQIGNDYTGIVTGASEKGYWVKLSKIPIEGKIVKNYQGLNVGDVINVKLINVNTALGYIDFMRI